MTTDYATLESMQFLDWILHLDNFILTAGLPIIALTVFAESGLLVGFFLPGDTLLLGAGILASAGVFPIEWLIITVIIAAVLGDNVGYSIGRRTGRRLLTKADGIIFRREYIERAEAFYQKHGGKTIVIARFIPIVRTFAPVVAGMSKMPRQRFTFFNIFGGVIWGAGVPLIGYWFGSLVPGIKNYIEPVLLVIVVGSFGLAAVHILKDQKTRKLLMQRIKSILSLLALNKKID